MATFWDTHDKHGKGKLRGNKPSNTYKKVTGKTTPGSLLTSRMGQQKKKIVINKLGEVQVRHKRRLFHDEDSQALKQCPSLEVQDLTK